MEILRSIAGLSTLPGPIVLAAGTFDGLHLGHQALIRRAMTEASHAGGTAVVMTFDRHPASLVRPDRVPKLLTLNAIKLALLQQMGVMVVLLLEFSEALASLPAEEFIRRLAFSARPLQLVCVGSQWSFGRGGAGNVSLLKQLGKEFGFSVDTILPVESGGELVSSTRIRDAIGSGNFQEAASCLGRSFLLSGTVVQGAGLGAKIGFPTANLDVRGMQLPPHGVYAVRIIEGKRMFAGAANIGMRPTVEQRASEPTVEVHIFDFSENLVGKELSIEFVQFLRGEQKFSTLASLTAQIERDCKQASEINSYPSRA